MNLTETVVRIWKEKGKIAEGIANSIFKQPHIEDVAHARLSICKLNSCQSYDTKGDGCMIPGSAPCCSKLNGGCGCNLAMATRSMSKECPKGYWPAELTDDEDKTLMNSLNGLN